MQGILNRVLSLWVRTTLRPEDAAARFADRTVPICYVLEQRSRSDFAVLQQLSCRGPAAAARPPPAGAPARPHPRLFSLSRSVGLWRQRLDRRPPELLLTLIDALRRDPVLDLNLVPAAVYWGRAPRRSARCSGCCSRRTG